MTPSKIRSVPVMQKEWYFIKKGMAHSFLIVKDFPFEIDSKFKSKVTGDYSGVGQIIRLHSVEENTAWSLITREFGRRSLRLLNYERINDRNSEANKLNLENIQNLKEEIATGRSRVIRFSSAYFIQGNPTYVMDIKRELAHHLKKLRIRIEDKRYSDTNTRNKVLKGDLAGIYLDPESASHLIPVNHGYLFHESGTFYGICETSRAPIFMNRSLFPSSHQLVLGMTGFGKSFFVKATMLREKITRNVRIKVIDPLGEYGNFARSIESESIDLLNQEMNMFEKVEFLTVKENVDRTMALLLTLFNLDNEDSGILDTGLTLMYEHDEGIEFLKQFIREHLPETYNKISPIFEGSLRKFSSGRNPNLMGDVRINLKNVPKKLLSFYMLLSLDLFMRSNENSPVNLVIDEAHYLLQDNVVGSLERYIRHARHSNVSMILISQSANDFLKNGSSTIILENCSIHVLFRHQVATDEMVKFYALDETLANYLKVGAGFNGKYSTGLFYAPGFRTIFRFESSPEEMDKVDGVP